MLSRVVIMADVGRGYLRGVARGVATFAAAHARYSWIPMIAGTNATNVLDDRKKHNIIAAIVCEGSGMDHAIRLGLPAVCISAQAAECPIPRVHSDDFAIGANVADHLMNTGLRNFAYVGGRRSVWFSSGRHLGFCDQLRKAGHADVPWLRGESPEWSIPDLADALANLAKPVGILASCDDVGANVIAACRESGLRVPEDVAVVGVDNDDLVCESTYPTMSSVPHEAGNVGYQVATILTRLIAGEKNVPSLTLVPPGPIVVRGSSDGLLMADPLVRDGVTFLRRHFAERIKIEAVADALCVCRKTLDVRFKAALGRTPADELLRLQISHAKRLLQTTDMAMSEVASSAGFSSPRQFSETFHREASITPTDFRRANRFRA